MPWVRRSASTRHRRAGAATEHTQSAWGAITLSKSLSAFAVKCWRLHRVVAADHRSAGTSRVRVVSVVVSVRVTVSSESIVYNML